MRPVLLTAALLVACKFQEMPPAAGQTTPNKMSTEFLGLRTAVYSAPNLAAAKKWYIDVLGAVPYFDEPFYVGFNVGGFELGIVPDSSAAKVRPSAGVAYWGVSDAAKSYSRLLSMGATALEEIRDVGEGIKIGSVRDPFGNVLGVIENPTFKFAPPHTAGPGR